MLSLAACNREASTDEGQNDPNPISYEAAAGADQTQNAAADQFENEAVMNSWDLGGSEAGFITSTVREASTSDEGATDDYRLPDELWIGAVGGADDGKCTKTTSGHIGTTPYIWVQHGEATILSETNDSVVLWTRRADTGKDMKMVFGASQRFCEDARKRVEREPFPRQ
jgi:hypothetical protein